ncbi:unnamed protein product [Polarella glacialis]|uniref:Deacetylase sirtuin-type domain-containing protein n=1 Tax=Polarella glacialis TaxID=89957 RepID=A0A813FCL9_POLGL|nr:unnamed protein product [Polarella glacialis]
MAGIVAACKQCCGEGCRYHGRHGQRSCLGCEEASRIAISKGHRPACAQCGRRGQDGKVDERQTRQFYCSACWAGYEGDRLVEYFDSAAELEAKCQRLASMIRGARHVIAFTGAGISTGAGIADFRSGMNTKLPTGPGLWELPKSVKPEGILEQCVRAKPGRTHILLFRLWKAGILKHVISQNVDGLHRKSGIPGSAMSELHGNIFVERCTACGWEYERDFNTICPGGFTGRNCEQRGCAGKLRHSGVGFGQDLEEHIVNKAWSETESADLCLALGSSITVTPASEMPVLVTKNHRRDSTKGLVIVNLQATPCDQTAALRVNGMVDDVMERVVEILGEQTVPHCANVIMSSSAELEQAERDLTAGLFGPSFRHTEEDSTWQGLVSEHWRKVKEM